MRACVCVYVCMYVCVYMFTKETYAKLKPFCLLLYIQYMHNVMYIVSYCMSVITQAGNSALMVAAREGETEVVVELVKAGANVDMKNDVCHDKHKHYGSPRVCKAGWCARKSCVFPADES